MPIWITVTTPSGDHPFQVDNSSASRAYILHVSDAPSNVQVDKDHWILRSVSPPFPTPAFDRQLLLVNGVDWNAYGDEILSAYQDAAFTGSYSLDFWDCFNQPSGGYPSTLPAPIGHGTIPPEVLAHYRTVVWIGNDYNGDLADWNDTPVISYLQAGGNLFLMTRLADQYLSDQQRTYLGITWLNNGTVVDCVSTYSGLTNIGRNGTQSSTAGFNTTALGSETTLLYKAVLGHTPNWGLGAIRRPAAGGTYNPNGGRLVLLSGRPYRWTHADLRTNSVYILHNFLGLPATSSAPISSSAAELSLSQGRPNPFRDESLIRFSLPNPEHAFLAVWDVAGRKVRTLVDGTMDAGFHESRWNGKDDGGHPLASGIYYLRLQAGDRAIESKLLRLR